MKKFVSILICLLAFVLVLTGCRKPDPMEKAQEYMSLWSDQNYEVMYDMLSPASKTDISRETFVNRYKNIFATIRLNRLKISHQEISVEEDHAYLPLTIFFDTDTVGSFEYDYVLPMLYEEGSWYIEWSTSLIFPMLQNDDLVYLDRHLSKRGSIVDRSGNPLAHNGPGYEVAGVPARIADQEEFAEALSPLLEVSQKYILNELNQDWVQPEHRVPLRNLPFNIDQELKDELLSIQGVLLSTIDMRQYPYEDIFAHITGYIGPITAEQLEAKADRGYSAGDLVGHMGLESSQEEELSGNPGYSLYVIDSGGNYMETLAHSPQQDGSDIVLTADAHLQSLIYQEMGEEKGTVVALNPETGEVLAMVSRPSYDPNVFPPGILPSTWKDYIEDEDNPFLNKALRALYPPGSTIKPFTAIMGLEQGIITPDTLVEEAKNLEWRPSPEWGDYHIRRVSHPQGDIDLDRALVWSNNIYFAWLALELGGETFERFAQSYGFGENMPFPLEVASSQVKNADSDWSSILLADTGYGQGEMLVTALELGTMFTSFANDGNMVEAGLIAEIRDPTGQALKSFNPKIWRETVIPATVLDDILPSLVNVIEDPTGTGHPARIPGLSLAGKTGTSQIGDQKEIGWFIIFTLEEKNPLLLSIALEVDEGQGDTKFGLAYNILTQYYGIE